MSIATIVGLLLRGIVVGLFGLTAYLAWGPSSLSLTIALGAITLGLSLLECTNRNFSTDAKRLRRQYLVPGFSAWLMFGFYSAANYFFLLPAVSKDLGEDLWSNLPLFGGTVAWSTLEASQAGLIVGWCVLEGIFTYMIYVTMKHPMLQAHLGDWGGSASVVLGGKDSLPVLPTSITSVLDRIQKILEGDRFGQRALAIFQEERGPATQSRADKERREKALIIWLQKALYEGMGQTPPHVSTPPTEDEEERSHAFCEDLAANHNRLALIFPELEIAPKLEALLQQQGNTLIPMASGFVRLSEAARTVRLSAETVFSRGTRDMNPTTQVVWVLLHLNNTNVWDPAAAGDHPADADLRALWNDVVAMFAPETMSPVLTIATRIESCIKNAVPIQVTPTRKLDTALRSICGGMRQHMGVLWTAWEAVESSLWPSIPLTSAPAGFDLLESVERLEKLCSLAGFAVLGQVDEGVTFLVNLPSAAKQAPKIRGFCTIPAVPPETTPTTRSLTEAAWMVVNGMEKSDTTPTLPTIPSELELFLSQLAGFLGLGQNRRAA